MFEDRTQEQIKTEMLADINPATGLSSMAGGFADAVVGAAARQISELYQALPAVVSMLFVDETSGGYLDLVGQTYFNITRRAGTKARCFATFTGAPGTLVPPGTVFLTATGLQFALVYQVRIWESGTAESLLEAVEAGEAYNIGPGELTNMWVNYPGLESYVNQQASGGTDEETDQQLYARIDEARKRPRTSGNGWDYRGWALEVEGVGAAKVVEQPQGPGTVEIMVADSTFHPADEQIRAAVMNRIAARRTVGGKTLGRAPTALEVAVAAGVTINQAVTTINEVSEQFQAELADYLHGLVEAKYGKIYYEPREDGPYTLRYNRVLSILLTIQGVEDFSVLTVNGGTADLVIQANQVPVLGEVSVT